MLLNIHRTYVDMLKFTIYNHPTFKSILCDVYDIKEKRIFDDEKYRSVCPFFMSTKILKKHLVFNMPFNFYYSPDLGKYEKDFFREIDDFSRSQKKNVILKSLVRYENRLFLSNQINSILPLDDENYEVYFRSLAKNFRQNINLTYGKGLMVRPENLRKLFGYLRKGDLMPLYRYFLMKIIWPLFHRELVLKNAMKVMEEEWDYLIVLEVYARNTLLRSAAFGAQYELDKTWPTDIYGSKSLLIYRHSP